MCPIRHTLGIAATLCMAAVPPTAAGQTTTLNACALFAILAQPFIPDAAKQVLDAIGVPERNRMWPRPDDAGVWDALPRGHKITPPDVLFKKIEDADVAAWSERFHGGG